MQMDIGDGQIFSGGDVTDYYNINEHHFGDSDGSNIDNSRLSSMQDQKDQLKQLFQKYAIEESWKHCVVEILYTVCGWESCDDNDVKSKDDICKV